MERGKFVSIDLLLKLGGEQGHVAQLRARRSLSQDPESPVVLGKEKKARRRTPGITLAAEMDIPEEKPDRSAPSPIFPTHTEEPQ